MQMRILMSASALAAICFSATAFADPVLDGSGFGAATATVAYDPTAPNGHFGSPGPTTSGAAYDIFAKSDATYAYWLIAETGQGTAPGNFANLYFGTGATASNGSDLGFEVTNGDAFTPGVSNNISTAGQPVYYSLLDGGSEIEFAVAFSYFETDPQGLGFSKTSAGNPDIILRLSQSYGYSVAGGASYGPNRLALITDPGSATTVPEPFTLSIFGAGLVSAAAMRRRKQKKA